MNYPDAPRSILRILFVYALTAVFAAGAEAADLFENFDAGTAVPTGWTDGGTANDVDAGHVQSAPNCRALGTNDTLQTPAVDFPTNLSFYVDASSGGNGKSATVDYSVGGGAWISLGSFAVSTAGAVQNFSLNSSPNLAASANVRFRFNSIFNTWYLDDVAVTVLSGPAEDPNLSVPSALAFGEILPGSAATQTLAIANTGASNTLILSSFSFVSGDAGKFAPGGLPASLAPGVSTNIRVVYTPGAVTGASHSATFRLVSSDPSTPTNPIVFSGSTPGASLTVSNVQYSVDGLSPQNGKRVTVSGIATYADPSGYALADASGGPWSGIYVSDVYHRPNLGDLVRLNALVQESSGLTQLATVSNYVVLATNQTVPVTAIRGNQLGQEAYEGVLVRITNTVVQNTNYGGGKTYWQVSDGSASFLVGTRAPYRYVWTNNARLTAIRGLSFTNYVSPRFDADFEGRPVFEYALRGLVMTPDGPRTNWTVHVRDDEILAVTNVVIPGVANVDTGGIIYPGLMDVHNHPAYNSFPTLMFNNFPFGHRDEWGEEDAEYGLWKTNRTYLRTAAKDSTTDSITKYGEILELMAGCIAIQGQSNADAEHTHPDVLLFNVEQFPARTWADIFPWTSTVSERTNLLAKIEGGAVNATIIHLCEGTDTVARAQFATWRDWGMLNETVAIIHGAALQPTDFAQMAAAGAKLIWSPMSNMKLYAGTANIKAAKQAGVTIAISPDWTPSGCYNILEELGYAWQLNATIFSNAFTAREMADMVTLNGAICAGLDHRYGKIAVGYNAGLCVIEGDGADPYMALIRARPPQVLLTIVDGTPRYGEPALMSALGVTGESVTVKGRAKKLNIAVVHPFLEYSQHTFATIRTNLIAAHGTLTPSGELDRDELQFLDFSLLQGGHEDDVAPFRADSPFSSAPSATVTNDVGGNLSLAFRYQDFWDNDTFITNLTHTISIAPARYSNLLVQTIATNRANTPANQTVPFTVGFRDMHTNYVFVFETRDAQGNVRTTVSTNVFKVKTYTGGDTDGDGMPNEWEIAYFGGFSNAAANGNLDGDWLDNFQEYVANTAPNSAGSVLTEDVLEPIPLTPDVWEIQSPVPTFTNRIYDVWYTTNLLGQIVWTPLNVGRTGNDNGTAVVFRVTNDLGAASYRTGVRMP